MPGKVSEFAVKHPPAARIDLASVAIERRIWLVQGWLFVSSDHGGRDAG